MENLFSSAVNYLWEHANDILPVAAERMRPIPQEDKFLNGTLEDYLNICLPLFKASITSDWSSAKELFDKHPELVRSAISDNYSTPLHVAALAAEETSRMVEFVNNLVRMMKNEELELETLSGHTALYLAVASSKRKMVEILVGKNPNLLNIPGSNGFLPLHVGAYYARRDIVTYLYNASEKLTATCWTPAKRSRLLLLCVEGDLFVIRMTHMKMAVEFPTEDDINDAIKLLKLVLMENIKTKSREPFDKFIVTNPFDPGMLFVAAEMGNTRFLVELIRSNHELIWETNSDEHTIFHIAVINRHQGIHNLLYEIGPLNVMIVSIVDNDGNNMLHLVGKTSKKMRLETTRASLLMQRELLWFKEVENLLPPRLKGKKNDAGQTPYELFSNENEDLVSQGLKWMRDCMVVATLIVTIAFAVAFTVPGGYDQNHGPPIFFHKRSFIVFVIADTISFFSSTTSLLVFLSILTSGYKQRDFLYSLPKKLLIGLATLFISVAAMMVTFCASFFVLYHKGLKWVPIVIATFGVMPVLIFAALQVPLAVDMFRSIYDSNYLFKPKKRVLFIRNPMV